MKKLNKSIRQAIILAAGRGSRLMPYTKNTPKPLMLIQGEFLLERQLKQMKKAGIESVTIHTSYLGEKIHKNIGNGDRFGLDINYAHSEQLLGAGGGIIFAKNFLKYQDEDFLLLNGDVYTDYDFSKIIKIKNKDFDSVFKLVLIENPAHNPKGDFCFNLDSKIIGPKNLENLLKSDNKYLTYSGIAVISPQVFIQNDINNITSFLVLIEPYLNDNLIIGDYHQGIWHDIGSPERLEMLIKL
tara:strand:+ start:4871 stop:5596 length:726 start_codon:yes stop_codon:yes gene_type:complete